MAITHTLHLASPVPAGDVAETLSSGPADDLLGPGVVLPEGLWLRVGDHRPRPGHPVVTDLGVTPTVWVVFRLDASETGGRLSAQEDTMVRLVVDVLDRVPGDLVLEHEFEDVWLARRAGDLVVSDREDLWTPRRLALLSPRRYVRAPLAFADA
jgi:hypothetical protein